MPLRNCLIMDCTGMSICKSFDVWTFISAIFWIFIGQIETCCHTYLVCQPKINTVLGNYGSLKVGGGWENFPPPPKKILALRRPSLVHWFIHSFFSSFVWNWCWTEQSGTTSAPDEPLWVPPLPSNDLWQDPLSCVADPVAHLRSRELRFICQD